MEMTKKYELPDDFAIVSAVTFKKGKHFIPKFFNVTSTIKGNLNEAIALEKCLFKHVMMLIEEIKVKMLLLGQPTMLLKKIFLSMCNLLSHNSYHHFMKKLLRLQ